MNRARRKRLDSIIEELEELQQEIATVLEEEQEAFDNLPESFQEGERGQTMQEAIDNLENVDTDIENIIETLREAQA